MKEHNMASIQYKQITGDLNSLLHMHSCLSTPSEDHTIKVMSLGNKTVCTLGKPVL